MCTQSDWDWCMRNAFLDISFTEDILPHINEINKHNHLTQQPHRHSSLLALIIYILSTLYFYRMRVLQVFVDAKDLWGVFGIIWSSILYIPFVFLGCSWQGSLRILLVIGIIQSSILYIVSIFMRCESCCSLRVLQVFRIYIIFYTLCIVLFIGYRIQYNF